ncbi:MAG: MFS transporter [Deltaproteobacteria bacterium]|nr:MFS transporter [Deltaproteobacteria bacterium]MBW1930772.1 MFS transporter [Deltaproteobacteria bacterium]MBW2024744.1 MFS transporter [Deltaproteobacteria bacterium]MBW2125555.1 MFS transporter [Deltaproteobacteria bacterium]RLB16710.1 MAG: MFS transporter [Deltaproteobacteria bacterium]
MDTEQTKKSALIIATLNSFITPFMGSSINVALPVIGKELQMDAVMLTWVATAYLLAVAVFLVPSGKLGDIYGRKRIFTVGIFVFIISSIFCAASFSTSMLVVFRVIQGIGNAMVFATGMAILVSVYPPQERGKVLGINVAAVYIGLSAGPFLGGLMTQHLSWRSIFLFTVPFCLLILFLIFWRLKGEWADARGEKFDFLGSVIYGVAITGIIIGISLLPALKSIWIILGATIALAVFVKWELNAPYPVFEVRLFRTNRLFAFSSLAALINYAATFALTFLLSLYLQHIKALSPQATGLVLVAQPLVMAILSPWAGRLSDRIEPRIVATSGMAITAFGLALLCLLDPTTSLAYIVGCNMVLGLGFALFSSPNTNAIMGSVEKRFLGIASGAVATMRSLGMMLSMGISTVIFSIVIGRVKITEEQYPLLMKSIVVALVVFIVLSIGGVWASMARGTSPKEFHEGFEL